MNEVRHIAKSIAKFTWKYRNTISGGYERKTTDEELKEIRTANAYQGHETKKAATKEKITRAFDKALREGIKLTQTNIAKLSGLGVRTVKRYWNEF